MQEHRVKEQWAATKDDNVKENSDDGQEKSKRCPMPAVPALRGPDWQLAVLHSACLHPQPFGSVNEYHGCL